VSFFVFVYNILVFSKQIFLLAWQKVCGAFPGVHGFLVVLSLLRIPVLISLALEILIGFYCDPILNFTLCVTV